METDWNALIAAARSIRSTFPLRDDATAGSVGAALLAASGNVYTGICIDLPCGLGFCAEVAAIAEALKARETHLVAAVAIGNGNQPIPPCGRCRETMAMLDDRNLDCLIAVSPDKKAPLRDLLPDHWLIAARR